MIIKTHFRFALLLAIGAWMLGQGIHMDLTLEERARKYTRPIEFDYLEWTLDTLWVKSTHTNHPDPSSPQAKSLVYYSIGSIKAIQTLQGQIDEIYADPNISAPVLHTTKLSSDLSTEQHKLAEMLPEVESILQDQVKLILEYQGISDAFPVFPPVLYHSSDVPVSLFISPRDRIELIGNISLQSPLPEQGQVQVENNIETDLDVSALVEPIGGLATYPSMIMLTTDLNWLIETIAHEWAHNYLSLHSLGMNYDSSPELRTMNETTANLVGKEIAAGVVERFYPELLPQTAGGWGFAPVINLIDPPFDFRREMRITRITVDRLLAEGRIGAAESYMESRRRAFWENGYLIRRINQAYFAFYGAYNDVPGGGPSGQDPVGPAVVRYRAQYATLGDFLHEIARMSSYQELMQALANYQD